MKKFLIVLLCLLLVLGIGGYFGYRYVLDTYLVMDGETIRRDVTELDLREDDLAELEARVAACLEEQGTCGSDYVKLQQLQERQAELEALLEEL